MTRYTLAISFKSNERPWRTGYRPYAEPVDDEAAVRWAAGMADKLLDYTVTLFKDGQAVPLAEIIPKDNAQ